MFKYPVDQLQADRQTRYALQDRDAAELADDNAARFADPTAPINRTRWAPLDNDPNKRWTFTRGLWEWTNPHDIWIVRVRYIDLDGSVKWTN